MEVARDASLPLFYPGSERYVAGRGFVRRRLLKNSRKNIIYAQRPPPLSKVR